jgi:hypothetical protein
MNHHFPPRAVSRARWLAELSAALEDAQKLLAELVAERIDPADAGHLRMRIEQLRDELQTMHRRGFAANQRIEAPRLMHADWRPRRD